MARQRQIYQCDVLYVGPTGANHCTGKHFSLAEYGMANNSATAGATGVNWVAEMFRVQTANYSFSSDLRDVNQFDELAAIDRIPLDPPTVSLDFSYLVANFINEKNMGLTISSGTQISAISGLLNDTTDGKNYFMRLVPEGNDAAGYTATTNQNVVGIGNGYISSYTAEGSVGNFPTATVRVDALNFEVSNAVTGVRIPAVNPNDGSSITGWYYGLISATQNRAGVDINGIDSISVLRPGDIVLDLGLGAGSGVVLESDMKAQSYNIGFDLRRTDLQKLGTKYAYSKVVDFPVLATMTVNTVVGDYQTGSLVEMVSNNGTVNPRVTIYRPGVTRDRANIICEYQLKGAKLRSQEFTSSIGPSKACTMTFEAQVGGPQNNTVGLFLSGIC